MSLFEAVIRYNANDNTQAFCCVDGIDTDIFIEGAVRQNRSVHGDLVVMRILGEEDWWAGGSNNGNNGKNGKSGTIGTDAKSKRQQRAGEMTTKAAGLDSEGGHRGVVGGGARGHERCGARAQGR